MNTHLDYISQFRSEAVDLEIPTKEQLRHHLRMRIETVGETAFQEYYYLQKLAAERWSASETVHFAHVLRDERGSHGAKGSTPWHRARRSISRLPADWRPAFESVADASEHKADRRAPVIWSAAHCKAVVDALARWLIYCEEYEVRDTPSAVGLNTYASKLIAGKMVSSATTLRSASDYIARIYSGYVNVLTPGFTSQACEFVLRDWSERAKAVGPTTKTGAQLVGAKAIYDLGFELMASARTAPVRGLNAATIYRNGLILSFGIALPQRARALSALAFDRSLHLLDEQRIQVRLCADDLKMLERDRNGQGFDWAFRNARLHAALHEYKRDFRPIFDNGSWLFPSRKIVGGAIAEKQIGSLAGSITEKALNERITIHRFRDNVSTDASEYMVAGPRASASLLGHRNEATTSRHYDHAEGVIVTKEFVEEIEARKTVSVELLI
ncbi:hypothetical protein [Sulfitobacter delicatus]|uniref:Phage integrase family protein n=1 Tax=Sulfitobacter delicatus TaxID=218672 RepID=A0A1G7U7J8_9RHOB|nr:hypothetical protein [Sulfitobacter delicatus]SDG43387.1 hypothetical protein SAMN04489759_107184 [Sulfitobacter delicatus]